MNPTLLAHNSKIFLSQEWKRKYTSLLESENWNILVGKLANLIHEEERLINGRQKLINDLPYFDEEVRIDERKIISCFLPAIQLYQNKKYNSVSEKLAEIIENIPFEYILAILGQRFTSASLRNEQAIPPLRSVLLESCFKPFNSQISKATREWEKHVGRHENNFWGEVKGNPKEKEEKVRKLILEMLENQTWWNVFHHYKHDIVYEIRVASGHGIRWNQSGTQLIGFLEHFLNNENE